MTTHLGATACDETLCFVFATPAGGCGLLSRDRRDGAIRQALYWQPDKVRHLVPAFSAGMELA